MPDRTVPTKAIDLTRLADDPTWPTQRQDLQAALTLIEYVKTRPDDPWLELEGWSQTADAMLRLSVPQLLFQLGQYYRLRYGEDGQLIFQRVLLTLAEVDSPPSVPSDPTDAHAR